jgi:hypothetical protein
VRVRVRGEGADGWFGLCGVTVVRPVSHEDEGVHEVAQGVGCAGAQHEGLAEVRHSGRQLPCVLVRVGELKVRVGVRPEGGGEHV